MLGLFEIGVKAFPIIRVSTLAELYLELGIENHFVKDNQNTPEDGRLREANLWSVEAFKNRSVPKHHQKNRRGKEQNKEGHQDNGSKYQ